MSLDDSEPEVHVFEDPTGLIRLPLGSVRVEDPEEEVFLLYTNLSTRHPEDISSTSFPGLGSVDSRQDTLAVRFVLPPSPTTKHKAPSGLEGAACRSSKRHDKRKQNVYVSEGERSLDIELAQDKTTLRSRRGDTGSSVLWRVSVALCQALLNDLCSSSSYSLFDPEKLKECTVLELGAGTGLLCLILAAWVRHYTVTDLDYLVPLIRKNVATNFSVVQQTLKPTRRPSSSSAVSVEPLNWVELQGASLHARNTAFRLSHGEPPDLIVLVDCVYNPALLPALLVTVDHYAAPGRTRVLVAVELRSVDVVREFLELWRGLGGWEIWRIGCTAGGGREGDGWLGIEFAVWIGWKISVIRERET
ncbi:uncharacterized protein FOMMEDRAFT_75265 [Fomitiporia mediterranea MF3/22]|uniref:uncharacterized protein n=1 Tax=Fomitiporia mediterranea (strain MF3/22) TaxID=694068 RepID=UPI0004407E98|nr:uncharacterized protein FOMMEDRAFT_75265 [Fomitiporia mediterranea MF3/22]EJD07584.1 hypothetical protein FOMMEDRAFT_75265 [Fomitiporia mediterranea MF3/22]